MMIEAAVVNHNTSLYTELLLRSLHSAHPNWAGYMNLRVFDNQSEDGLENLLEYAGRIGVPVLQTGFTTDSANNSHGEVMRRFVLERTNCTHYLFLDADTVFIQPETIGRLATELDQHADAFGINPRMSWDGHTPYDLAEAPLVYGVRIHPFCALIRNTELFRTIVQEIGLSCARYLWANEEEYLDTFTLMTKVMRTHGLKHYIGDPLVIHFFSVSYQWDDEETRQVKTRQRDALLAKLRSAGHLQAASQSSSQL